MTEAPSHPGFRTGGERPGVQKIPRQIQERWWQHMDALPSQVLRPLRDATKRSMTLAHRRCRRNHARERLTEFKRDMSAWMESVDAMLRRHGVECVDITNPERTAEFHARLNDSERRALAKYQRVRGAIAYAEMSLEWLDWDLQA